MAWVGEGRENTGGDNGTRTRDLCLTVRFRLRDGARGVRQEPMKLLYRLTRKLVPSLVLISRTPLLAFVLDTIDTICSLPFAEFRGLPPNRFRLRVGIGNRILFNQPHFLALGAGGGWQLFQRNLMHSRSNVLDIGCGCGRTALALRDLFGFSGMYTGLDVDREMIGWCQRHFSADHFTFVHLNVWNALYHPKGEKVPCVLPLAAESTDLVFAFSLFTHLLEHDVANYAREAFRVLKPGGTLFASVFCWEDMRDTGKLGARWTFPHQMENAHVESLRYPEAAVAYDKSFLTKLCQDAGFEKVEIQREATQSSLICSKNTSPLPH